MGYKILLAEDSEVIAKMMENYLSSKGYTIKRVSNGLDAIIEAYNFIPDLIIMDVEMPILKGYQASRMLKSRRYICDIPILLHTSLADNKDKFWGMASGADDYLVKDYDNLENVDNIINKYINHKPYNIEKINEEAKKINKEYIFEMMGLTFDTQLYRATILNQLDSVVKAGNITDSLRETFKILKIIVEYDIAVIFLLYKKTAISFIYPENSIYEKDTEEFYKICLHDFLENFKTINPDKISRSIFNISHRDDYKKIRLDKKSISSYKNFPLYGKCGEMIGSLHLGTMINNYFSEYLCSNIEVFCKSASIILENTVLFEQMIEINHRIKNVFAKFVPEDVINDLVEKDSAKSLMMSEKRNLVVLFSDIRDFTKISEINSAEDVVSFLNSYFSKMVSIITKYGGTIDKFIGDAILAIFGAPKSYENNAERAVRASLEMLEELNNIEYKNLKLPDEKISIGIGLHEGEAIVGSIGSKDKFDYTVIGDTVNLASRLEGLTKHYKLKLLISEPVKNKVENEFTCRFVDNVKVKGKDIANKIYAITKKDLKYEEDLSIYNKAINMYRMKNFKISMDLFKEFQVKYPDDYITKIYLDRINYYLENPVPDDWDGSISFDSK